MKRNQGKINGISQETTSLWLALLLGFLLVLTYGCGYHNPYAESGGRHIRLYHQMWKNRTTEVGLDNTFYQDQSDWLRRSPLISLTDSPASADYELIGSIDRLNLPEISFGAYQEGIEGRADLTVSFAIKEVKTGKIVWERKSAQRQETFYMTQDPLQLQANRRTALNKIADDFAEEIYLQLLKMTRAGEPKEP